MRKISLIAITSAAVLAVACCGGGNRSGNRNAKANSNRNGRGDESLIQYVETMVGTGERINIENRSAGRGQTIPAVLVPNGMNFWTAQTEGVENKCVSPYYYFKDKISGFRASHWIVGGCTQDYGSVTIMPEFGTLVCQSVERASAFDHADETTTPAYYSVPLFGGEIFAEMTGTSRTGIFRFTYSKAGKAYLVVNPNSDEAMGSVKIDPETFEISGSNPVHRIYQGKGQSAGFSGHFSVTVKKAASGYGVYQGENIYEGKTEISNQSSLGAYLAFDVKAGEEIIVKVATSFCDVDGARNNQKVENPGWKFDPVKKNLEKIWEDRLGAIVVKTDDVDAKNKFYTSLYHASFLPHAFNDCDGRYPSFAGGQTIEKSEGVYYEDYSMWDTYRALHPLLSFLYPEQTGDMIQSLVDKYKQGGWLPIFPCWNSYTSEMIGDHCASLISDAYRNGIRNFDVDEAYTALRKNAFELPESYEEYADGKGRRALDSYMKYGYIPLDDPVKEAFHKAEQVSRTLEYAYDDYALSQFAEALGHTEDAAVLKARSQSYRNVVDPRTGWAQGRFADGSFLVEDNEFTNCSFITEGTPSVYTWYVPHDVYGLMECMGGRETYLRKLDEMFEGKHYEHGNEPSHQIAFMYNYAGQPWKTQKIVRDILENEYHSGADGLSGNDDAGQMSAWYVFAAIGFYPVCPSSGEYMIASPSFDKAELRMASGKIFTVETVNASKENIYIQSATLNGQPYDKNYIMHSDIAEGGYMVFEMGPAPNENWGSSESSLPVNNFK